jgi:hypothetical protein
MVRNSFTKEMKVPCCLINRPMYVNFVGRKIMTLPFTNKQLLAYFKALSFHWPRWIEENHAALIQDVKFLARIKIEHLNSTQIECYFFARLSTVLWNTRPVSVLNTIHKIFEVVCIQFSYYCQQVETLCLVVVR